MLRGCALGAGVAAVLAGSAAGSRAAPAPAAPKPFTRADAAAISAHLQKIVSPRGIDELEKIPIAGTDQWISVRGRDRRNPILLFIHGGPAAPEMPTSWTFQNDWEDFFTVVQWDQRGAGKSYLANDPRKIRPTLSVERITRDAAAVVRYLRERFQVPKIFVIAHSWGTVPGLRLAAEHPEWLYAYVGMGQIVDFQANEREGYAATLAAARAAHDARAVRELEAIAPYPDADGTIALDKIDTERKWSVYFGGLSYRRHGYGYYFQAAALSPDYSDRDRAAIDAGSKMSLPALLPELARVSFAKTTQFRCPIVIFAGRHDETTPSDLAAAWFKSVHAPVKKFVWFENSAHMMQIEQPGLVLMHLVDDVRPLAGTSSVPDSRTPYLP